MEDNNVICLQEFQTPFDKSHVNYPIANAVILDQPTFMHAKQSLSHVPLSLQKPDRL